MIVFFEYDENGKILVCSTEKMNKRMKHLKIPENFDVDNIQKYIVKKNEVVLNEEYQPPVLFTLEDRLKAIEDAITFLRKLLGVKD